MDNVVLNLKKVKRKSVKMSISNKMEWNVKEKS